MAKDPNSICLWCNSNLTVYAESVKEGKPDGRYTDKYCQSCYNRHKYKRNFIISKNRIEKDKAKITIPKNEAEIIQLQKDDFERLYIKNDSDFLLGINNSLGNCGIYKISLIHGDQILNLYVGESNNLIRRMRDHINNIFKDPGCFGIEYKNLLDGWFFNFSLLERVPIDNYSKNKNKIKELKWINEIKPLIQENESNDKRISNFALRKLNVQKAINEKE